MFYEEDAPSAEEVFLFHFFVQKKLLFSLWRKFHLCDDMKINCEVVSLKFSLETIRNV